MKRRRFRLTRVLKEVVFGVEDSLVSTLGTITGIAVGTGDARVVILSGVVLLVAESLSMTAGSYLASESEGEVWLQEHADDWDTLMRSPGAGHGPIAAALDEGQVHGTARERILKAVEMQRRRWLGQMVQHERQASPSGSKSPVLAGTVMGVSYFAAGIIPLGAYLIIPVEQAVVPSIVVTLFTLFLFGLWKAALTKRSAWRSGVEMVVVAAIASGASYALGLLARLVIERFV